MYDINLKNVRKGSSFFYVFFIGGIIVPVIFILCLSSSNEYRENAISCFPLFLLLSFAFLYVSIKNIIKINKRIEIIKELNQKGKLIKGLKYHLEDTGMSVNDVHIKKPVVYYTLPTDS